MPQIGIRSLKPTSVAEGVASRKQIVGFVHRAALRVVVWVEISLERLQMWIDFFAGYELHFQGMLPVAGRKLSACELCAVFHHRVARDTIWAAGVALMRLLLG